jgi:hypothetical protein
VTKQPAFFFFLLHVKSCKKEGKAELRLPKSVRPAPIRTQTFKDQSAQISVSAGHGRMLLDMLACPTCALGNPTRWSPARIFRNNPHRPSAW